MNHTTPRSRRLLATFTLLTFTVVANGFAPFTAQPITPAQVSQIDLLIRGGKIVDGSGSAPFRADLGIRGDRIVFMGDATKSGLRAAHTIQAAGLVVAPGFIDTHTHTWEMLWDPARNSNECYLMQGVTTVITGNDGRHTARRDNFTIAQILSKWEQQGIGTNAALLVGHAVIREQVMRSNAPASHDQLDKMKKLLAQAMDEGALGMSTGLYYYGANIKTDELIELGKVLGAKGGILDSHIRDESSYSIGLIAAIQEELRIGREAKVRVNISHIKALGPEVWGKSTEVIGLIKKARAEGLEVTADQYPYAASGTDLYNALAPRGGGGLAQMLKRAEDPNLRPQLIAEMEANLKRRGGPETLLITQARDRQLVGKTLGAVARQWNKSPIEAALDLIKVGGNHVASFNMNERDVKNFMRQNFVMTASDGSEDHPRKYGTFPRKLREYVYNKKLISLPFAIRSSSALAAETFGISERGKLRVGYFADVIVFDEKTVADRATYVQPELLAVGMQYVIVNGKVAVDQGKYTGILAGRALRKNKS